MDMVDIGVYTAIAFHLLFRCGVWGKVAIFTLWDVFMLTGDSGQGNAKTT